MKIMYNRKRGNIQYFTSREKGRKNFSVFIKIFWIRRHDSLVQGVQFMTGVTPFRVFGSNNRPDFDTNVTINPSTHSIRIPILVFDITSMGYDIPLHHFPSTQPYGLRSREVLFLLVRRCLILFWFDRDSLRQRRI